MEDIMLQIVLITNSNNGTDIETFEFPILEADNYYRYLESQLISYKTPYNYVEQILSLYNEIGICALMSRKDKNKIIRMSVNNTEFISQ